MYNLINLICFCVRGEHDLLSEQIHYQQEHRSSNVTQLVRPIVSLSISHDEMTFCGIYCNVHTTHYGSIQIIWWRRRCLCHMAFCGHTPHIYTVCAPCECLENWSELEYLDLAMKIISTISEQMIQLAIQFSSVNWFDSSYVYTYVCADMYTTAMNFHFFNSSQ